MQAKLVGDQLVQGAPGSYWNEMGAVPEQIAELRLHEAPAFTAGAAKMLKQPGFTGVMDAGIEIAGELLAQGQAMGVDDGGVGNVGDLPAGNEHAGGGRRNPRQ